ncbi:MAG: enolase C-terminal domain-like protein [Nocardioides sp.]
MSADVTAGEYGYDLTYFDQMTRASAAVAQARNLDVSGHCAPSLTVPVAAATSRLRHLEWFHDHVRIEQRFFDGCLDPTRGELVPLGGPGHGLSLRPSVADDYRVA